MQRLYRLYHSRKSSQNVEKRLFSWNPQPRPVSSRDRSIALGRVHGADKHTKAKASRWEAEDECINDEIVKRRGIRWRFFFLLLSLAIVCFSFAPVVQGTTDVMARCTDNDKAEGMGQ